MIPAAFDYVRADSADEAIALLAEHGDDAKLLAGGMSLLPLMKLRLATPTVLVDVGRAPRPLVRPRRRRPRRDRRAHPAPRPRDRATLLARECGVLRAVAGAGRRQPGAPPRHDRRLGRARRSRVRPPGRAARARRDVRRAGPGRRARRSPPTDFFQGFLETALAPDELLTEIRVPKTGRERLRVPEVQPAGAGLGDRRRVAARVERRDTHVGARQHGLDAAARDRGRERRSAEGASRGRRRRARGRRAPSRRRPQRVARVPRAPRPGARAPARSRRSEPRTAAAVACSRPAAGCASAATTPSRCWSSAAGRSSRTRLRRGDGERARAGRGRRVRRSRRSTAVLRRRDVEVVAQRRSPSGHRVEPAGRAACARSSPTPRSTASWSGSPTSRWSARRRTGGVAAAYDDGAALAVATYGGARGNPVLIGRAHWAEALALDGDEGARVLFRRHGAVEVPCDGHRRADRRRHPRRPRPRLEEHDGDRRQLPSEHPDRRDLEGAARHRGHRAVPARRAAPRGRGRRVPRRREGEGRPDHRAVQGHRHARRGRRGEPPHRDRRVRARHARPGQRQGHDRRDDDATTATAPASTSSTDLSITGKVAQFGRGVLADVSSKLLGQFVENLERDVLSTRRRSTRHAGGPYERRSSPSRGRARRAGRPTARPRRLGDRVRARSTRRRPSRSTCSSGRADSPRQAPGPDRDRRPGAARPVWRLLRAASRRPRIPARRRPPS